MSCSSTIDWTQPTIRPDGPGLYRTRDGQIAFISLHRWVPRKGCWAWEGMILGHWGRKYWSPDGSTVPGGGLNVMPNSIDIVELIHRLDSNHAISPSS